MTWRRHDMARQPCGVGSLTLLRDPNKRTLCTCRFFASQPLPLKRPTNTPSVTAADAMQGPGGGSDPLTCCSTMLLCVHSGPAAGCDSPALADACAC